MDETLEHLLWRVQQSAHLGDYPMDEEKVRAEKRKKRKMSSKARRILKQAEKLDMAEVEDLLEAMEPEEHAR